jgi:hypothetical protein
MKNIHRELGFVTRRAIDEQVQIEAMGFDSGRSVIRKAAKRHEDGCPES